MFYAWDFGREKHLHLPRTFTATSCFPRIRSSAFRNCSPISASHANIATGWSLKISREITSLAPTRINEALLSLACLILFTIVYIGLKSSQAGLVVLMTVRLMFRVFRVGYIVQVMTLGCPFSFRCPSSSIVVEKKSTNQRRLVHES